MTAAVVVTVMYGQRVASIEPLQVLTRNARCTGIFKEYVFSYT